MFADVTLLHSSDWWSRLLVCPVRDRVWTQVNVNVYTLVILWCAVFSVNVELHCHADCVPSCVKSISFIAAARRAARHGWHNDFMNVVNSAWVKSTRVALNVCVAMSFHIQKLSQFACSVCRCNSLSILFHVAMLMLWLNFYIVVKRRWLLRCDTTLYCVIFQWMLIDDLCCIEMLLSVLNLI